MDLLLTELLVSVAANGLWAFVGRTGIKQAQAFKEHLVKNKSLDHAIQKSISGLAEIYPLGLEVERTRLTKFLASPEVETVIRQLYSSHTFEQPDTALIRQEFSSLFSLHIGSASTETARVAEMLFQAITTSCSEVLEEATKHGILAAHEAMSSLRHRQLADELGALKKNIELLTAAIVPDVALFLLFEENYRRQVGNRHSYIQPPHFDTARKVPIGDLYVTPAFSIVPKNKQSTSVEASLNNILDQMRRTVILGNPGGGKSTLAAKLAHDVASKYDDRIACNRALSPILVVLRDYGRQKKEDACSILQFIERQSNSLYQVPPPPGALEYLLLNGRALVIFDGLDELLETSYRQEVSADVESFCTFYPAVPVLVTSREVGYAQAPLDERSFVLFKIAEFNEPRIMEYAAKWFSHDEDLNEQQQQQKAAAFVLESSVAPDLRSNPLMLALMCNLYRIEGYIPRNRADVYEKCSVMLFERWDKGRNIVVQLEFEDKIRPAMQHLAYWIYSDKSLQGGVTSESLVSRTSEYLAQWVFEDPIKAMSAAKGFIDFCTGRAWVFSDMGTTGQGEKLFQFTHRTLLEYFAACHLLSLHPTPETLARELKPRIRMAEWDVVALLSFQLQARRVQGAADQLLSGLLNDVELPAAERASSLSFSGRCLEAIVPSPPTRRAIALASLDFCIKKEFARAVSAPSPDGRGEMVLRPLLEIGRENRSSVIEVSRDHLIKVLKSGHKRQGLRALEVMHFFKTSGRRIAGNLEASEAWRTAIGEVRTECSVRIRELVQTDAFALLSSYFDDETPLENLIRWGGPKAVWTGAKSRLFGWFYVSVASFLLRSLNFAEQGRSHPRSGTEITDLGRILMSTARPWTKRVKAQGFDANFAFETTPQERTATLLPDALFGAFCVLAVHSESSDKAYIEAAKGSSCGFGRALSPILNVQRPTVVVGELAQKIVDCGFNTEQTRFVKEWLEGREQLTSP